MKVSINNRHSKVSPAIQEKIEQWLETSQNKYGEISSAQVIIEQSDRQDEVEATLHIKGKDVFAKATGENLYLAIDALSDKIDRQLAKIKEKLTHKKGAQKPAELIDEKELEAEFA
ncbi:ribosome hibernation-promoting factor, HPF/YfiA family [Motiliproteus sp. MSK22-1]|uniref:ribosome hibernation-promoting factor, HPF/YfiA family n=1 Tax=Motiliproteus sp. MSK22-1 TaxID=1897630 RepID=UPI00097718B5|nr:ribosome-associated translation inhibitor RaiA [Motiliproteus sp. MSK22-1]OMH33980.1 ribosomal subunit interface protein [Motiliproteus sp. MSK22-1]